MYRFSQAVVEFGCLRSTNCIAMFVLQGLGFSERVLSSLSAPI